MAEDVSVCGVWFGRDVKGEKSGVNSFLILPLSNSAPTSHLPAHHCWLPPMRLSSVAVAEWPLEGLRQVGLVWLLLRVRPCVWQYDVLLSLFWSLRLLLPLRLLRLLLRPLLLLLLLRLLLAVGGWRLAVVFVGALVGAIAGA
jgi:hypothetical protein